MVKIANTKLNCFVGYMDGDIEIIVPNGAAMADSDISAIRDASAIEEIESNFGGEEQLRGTYALFGWKSVEKLGNDLRFRWQTYRTTDVNQIKQDTEDLTAAVLELAAIIGGDTNG